MTWVYVEREQFVRSCDKLKVTEKTREGIQIWATSVSNKYQTNRQKLVFRSVKNRYEAWAAGIPNPDSNKGKSGGYRVVYFFNLSEQTINLDFIDIRDSLGFKKEGPKKKGAYNTYIRGLKRYLNRLDNNSD